VITPGASPAAKRADSPLSAAHGGTIKRRRRLQHDRRGIVMAEFVIALVPVMIAFLGFTQFCFAAIAKLAVRHAAALATRAACVVLEEADGIPGAPANIYNGLKAGGLEVSRPTASQSGAKSDVDNSQSQVSTVTSSGSSSGSLSQNMQALVGGTNRTDSRIKQIRTAAYWPLLAISPSVVDDGISLADSFGQGELTPKMKVRDAIGDAGLARLGGALLYNMGAVSVTFPDSPGSEQLSKGTFERGAQLTTRVSYLFRCQVPLVSLLMCSSGWALLTGTIWADPFTLRRMERLIGSPPQNVKDLPAWVDRWKNTQALNDRGQQRIDAFQGHEADFKEVELPFMRDVLLALPGARYMLMTAEAQLPLQSAQYYPRVSDEDMQNVWKQQDQSQGGGSQSPSLSDSISQAVKPIGDAAKALGQEVDQVAGEVNGVRDDVNDGVNTAKGAANQGQAAYGAAKNVAKDPKAAAKGVENQALGQLGSATNQAENTLKNAGNAAKNAAVQGVKDTAGDLKKTAKDAAKDFGSNVFKAPTQMNPSDFNE
jgi:hypothetical protein